MQIQQSQQQIKAHNIFQNQRPHHFYLKSLSPILNDFLSGGLHTGMITQIYGQAGSGKTQIAMLFAISAIYSNMLVGYLATEKQLHWGRFTQLSYNYMNQAQFDQKQCLFKYKKTLDDFDAQMNFIQHIFNQIQKSKKPGLLIIDNIQSFIHSSFAYYKIQDSAYEKTRKQSQIINKIRKLAKTTNTCVLVINKVVSVIEKKRKSMGGRDTAPALGGSWELNVDESFQLKKGERKDIKEMVVVHSPKCEEGKLLYRIEESGFTFINQEGVEF